MRLVCTNTHTVLISFTNFTMDLVNYIHKYYIDPKSKLPHPTARIVLAIEEAKVSDNI